VVSQAIGFDDELQIRPHEVDAELTDPLLCLGSRQLRPPAELQEAPLELRVGESERPAVEDPRERWYSVHVAVVVDLRAQALRVNELQLVRAAHASLECVSMQSRREIDQGATGSRDTDPLAFGVVALGEMQTPVDANANQPVTLVRGNRDVNRPRSVPLPFSAGVRLPNTPKLGSALMTEHRVTATGQHLAGPPSASRQPGSANGVDTAPERVQPALRDPTLDLLSRDASLE
jgi:hypothetical protein